MVTPLIEESQGRWCLAGTTTENLVYCISVDSVHFDVHLWQFSPLRNFWRLLTKAASNALTTGHHYCTLAACNDNHSVWAYLETSDNTACLFCFNAQPDSADDPLAAVYTTADGGSTVNFDNTTGPQLVHFHDSLLVCGATLQDYGNTFRVYKLDIDEANNGHFVCRELFQLDMAWETLTSATTLRVTIWQDRLTFVEPERVRFLDFRENQNEQQMNLQEVPVIVPTGGNKAFFMLDCCVTNFGRDLWLINAFGWSKLNQSTPFSWTDEPVDEDPIQILDCCKKCVSSDSLLFWVDSSSTLRTKRVGLSSLQYLCFNSLANQCPLLKTFDEGEAKKFGIPRDMWKRFIGSCDSAKTVVVLE